MHVLWFLLVMLALYASYLLGKARGDSAGHQRGKDQGYSLGKQAEAREAAVRAQTLKAAEPDKNRGNRRR